MALISPAARIAPSILSADFAALGEAIDEVAPEADMIHVDVMDGHFVPNITIGPPVVKSLRARTDLYLDCHLMISEPGRYLEDFRKAGADGCTVHVEVGGTADLVAQMRHLGLDVGVAANPSTPFEAYAPFLPDIDLALVMTVVAGFGGQAFMPEVMPKLRRTRDEVDRLGLSVAVGVDGGIDERTASVAVEAGASVFVAGSSIYGAESPCLAARRLRAAVGAAPRVG